MCTSCIQWERARKAELPQNGPRHHLKYHLQLKTKVGDGGWGSQFWEVTRESTINKGRLFHGFKALPSPLMRVPRDGSSGCFWYREGDTFTEGASLINVNVSYTRVTSTHFQSFSWVFNFLKVISLE